MWPIEHINKMNQMRFPVDINVAQYMRLRKFEADHTELLERLQELYELDLQKDMESFHEKFERLCSELFESDESAAPEWLTPDE